MALLPRRVAEPPAGGLAPLCGLVLAGGRSERLGRDKAAVVFENETLLERAVALLAPLVGEVRVAVRPDQLTDRVRNRFALVADVASGIGPAAGILAAHRLHPAAAWLVLACDMPRVTVAMLGSLIARRDPARLAIAFRSDSDGRPEPLCALYEPATLARFRSQVEAGGDASPRRWLAGADPILLDAPPAGTFGSINTPEDLARLGGTKPPADRG